MSVLSSYLMSNLLRRDLRILELRDVTAIERVIDLIVQLGHAGDELLLFDTKLKTSASQGNKVAIQLKLAAFAFSLFSLADYLNYPVIERVRSDCGLMSSAEISWELYFAAISQQNPSHPEMPASIYMELVAACGRVASEAIPELRGDGEKLQELSSNIVEVLHALVLLAGALRIDMDLAFEQLALDMRQIIDLELSRMPLVEISDVAAETNRFFAVPLLRLEDVHSETKPFILLRPTAMSWLDFVREQLTESNLSIDSECAISRFELFARNVYGVSIDQPDSYQWLILSRALLGKEADSGHVFIINSKHLSSYARLLKFKSDVRQRLGISNYRVRWDGKQESIVQLHHLHCPDYDKLEYEYACLLHCIEVL